MLCKHLKELYQYVQEQRIRLSSMDLIHIVCEQCNAEDTCPSIPEENFDEYQQKRAEKRQAKDKA